MKRLIIAAILGLLALPAQAQQQDVLRPLTSYTMSISTTQTALANAIGAQHRYMRVLCTVTCFVSTAVSTINTALTIPVILNPNTREYFKVSPGTFVHVNAQTGSGSLFITEMEP